ncbi:endonuclease/exonuclease/phosphatase family protein [Mycobacterium sp. GA-2829]|uniref:endonuclease/exonuclease/phosphatase family protein n=1 Tax=Mycobacterium sp. GA-2829 TaxID=1772283 RepID=UPI001E60A062|nr:endonuclease/exonuclease/phosphatase family protein [Mycobacterium sp. GA-2829]
MITAAFFPYLTVFGLLSVVCLLTARHLVLALVAVGLTTSAVATQVPLYVSSESTHPSSASLRVVSANMREGQGDAREVVNSTRDHADVVAIQELTPDAVDRLVSAGMDTAFPYRWLDARDSSHGVGLWSRYPLETPQRIQGYTFAMVSAQIPLMDVATAPIVVVLHVAGPWPNTVDDWRRDFERLPATLHDAAERGGDGCVIVAGDFNATTDMRQLRDLFTDGYRDAAEQSGAGIMPTFPADSRLPPLLAIDRVLTRQCDATSMRTLPVPGSDHRGVAATILIARKAEPPGPGRSGGRRPIRSPG